MTIGNASSPFGAMLVACVAVAIVRLPMVAVTAVVAIGIGLIGDFDVGVRRAIGVTVLAWPLWAILLVALDRFASSRRDNGTTRIDVAAICCAATAGSLVVSSALIAGGPAGGLAYGLIIATITCAIDILGLTHGRPFATDWRAPTTCSTRSNQARR